MKEAKQNAEIKLHCPTDREYVDIIKSDIEIDRKYVEGSGQPAKIVYYCRECKKPVIPKRIGKKLSFRCSECNKESVSFGTESSIASYYNLK
jgi:DNA-directed RNA polymerase subunit RPC12/RpoP